MGDLASVVTASVRDLAAKRLILFVDDDQGVLDGLRNVLHGRRHEWQMVFVRGGEAALAEIAARSFDVVVSDMHMPGIDGVTLLTKVKQKDPRTVRIVLTGQVNMDTAMRTVFVAHQFLSKPCDVETLRNAVERACKLNAMLQSESLRNVAGDVSMLPSAPGMYLAITRALASPTVSISDVARIVERDPGLCAKILQVANSAFFGIGRKVTNVTEASTYLGMTTLKNLALALESFPQLERAGSPNGKVFRSIQTHSMLVAFLAREIVGSKDKHRSDEAFVAGMLHDVGQVIMAMRQNVAPDVKNIDHATLGAYLLGIWGLPHPIIEAVANHNSPDLVEHSSFEVVDAVYLADRIASRVRRPLFDHVDQDIDIERLRRLGILSEQIAQWEASARHHAEALSAL